jgi:hypothetical protein
MALAPCPASTAESEVFAMKTAYGLSVLAAFSLAGAAYAQKEPGPAANTPSTSVMHPTPNPELDGASTAARQNPGPTRMATAAPGKVATGMQVRSESGDLLGNVASIVPGESNGEGYVVVASANGVATPLPYSTASAMVQNETMVVNKNRFEQAPKVQQYQGEDVSRAKWEKKADSYWKRYAMSPEQPAGAKR